MRQPDGLHLLVGDQLSAGNTSVFSSERNAGFYRVFTELDTYAALDRLAAAAKDDGSNFGRLIREHSGMDYGWDAPFSNGLHKRVVDAMVFDPPSSCRR